jgi:nucleoside-diphosphate-sugar epimerase
MWGSGEQKRSFLYIEDCIDAVRLLMESDYTHPINIGSEESVTIKQLWETAIGVSGSIMKIESVARPENTLGVVNRNSDNTLIKKLLNWEPKYSLKMGIEKTCNWIYKQVNT